MNSIYQVKLLNLQATLPSTQQNTSIYNSERNNKSKHEVNLHSDLAVEFYLGLF